MKMKILKKIGEWSKGQLIEVKMPMSLFLELIHYAEKVGEGKKSKGKKKHAPPNVPTELVVDDITLKGTYREDGGFEIDEVIGGDFLEASIRPEIVSNEKFLRAYIATNGHLCCAVKAGEKLPKNFSFTVEYNNEDYPRDDPNAEESKKWVDAGYIIDSRGEGVADVLVAGKYAPEYPPHAILGGIDDGVDDVLYEKKLRALGIIADGETFDPNKQYPNGVKPQ